MSGEESIWLHSRTRGSVFRNLTNYPFTNAEKLELCVGLEAYHVAYSDFIDRRKRMALEGMKIPKCDPNGVNIIHARMAEKRYKIPRRTIRGWLNRWKKFPDGLHEVPSRPLMFDDTAVAELKTFLIEARALKKTASGAATNIKLNQLRNETRQRRGLMPTVHKLTQKVLRRLKKRYAVHAVVGQQMNQARVVAGSDLRNSWSRIVRYYYYRIAR
jgi:hypothetical protein